MQQRLNNGAPTQESQASEQCHSLVCISAGSAVPIRNSWPSVPSGLAIQQETHVIQEEGCTTGAGLQSTPTQAVDAVKDAMRSAGANVLRSVQLDE